MTTSENKFTEEEVLWVKQHSPKHLTFAISRPEAYRFSAGQFARLGFRAGTDGNGFIWRAYSMISAEYADTLEFFVILIDGGGMSARLAALQAGDRILLDKTAQGFFLPGRFPDGKDLIMLSTGSGIAPFLSILQQPAVWERFDTLALAHSVSFARDLIFNDWIRGLSDHPLIAEHIGHGLCHAPQQTARPNHDGKRFLNPKICKQSLHFSKNFPYIPTAAPSQCCCWASPQACRCC